MNKTTTTTTQQLPLQLPLVKEFEFNYFEYFKVCLLKAYYARALKGLPTDEFTFEIKANDNVKNTYFHKSGALKFVNCEISINEMGKWITLITVKDVKLDTLAVSKEGKKYYVFDYKSRGRAITKAMQELA